MRSVAVICAILAVGAANSAAAQIYPYLATLPVPDLLTPVPATPPGEPQGLAFDPTDGFLLIAEGPNQVVQIFDATNFDLQTTIGIAGVSGSDGGHFSNPGGVAFDPARNRILVADTGNDRVQIFDSASLALLGTLGTTGIPGADASHLSSPASVAVDLADALILVADTANDRVQLFGADSLALVGTIGVAGTPGSDNTHLSAPQAVAFDDATGHILVADTGNDRIQVFDLQAAAYVATIGPIGAVTDLAVDVPGRHLFAANPGQSDVFVFDADSLAPVAGLGLIGSFGSDNARFQIPSGLAFDPATGRIFAADAFLERIQIFGQPSALVAAVSPDGRAVAVDQSASIFATIINTGTVALDTCQIALPNDAPAGLALTFQTTDPTTNHSTGQPNQPVSIAAGAAQSFVMTLSSGTPVTALGESFLFGCDGTTPAPVFSGINTADLTISATPTADVIAAAATPGQTGIISVPEGTNPFVAFPVAAFNLGAGAPLQVSADSGSFFPVDETGETAGFKQTLPLTVQICQTNPLSGQCLNAPAPEITVDFPRGATATFTVFLAATGPVIPESLQEPRLFLRFNQATGAPIPDSVGNTSVAVVTVNNQ
jgi:DNA-binding beta-propeller fold protein YncE